MRCPKCQFDHELQTTECLKCGIIFSRYRAALETAAANRAASSAAVTRSPESDAALSVATVAAAVASIHTVEDSVPFDARAELKYRIFAVPLALLVARLMAHTPLGMAAGLLTMVPHECGHAITAWLTGRWAVPLLWVTMHGDRRSWAVVVGLAAAIVFAGFLAWRAERWGWVATAGAALLVQMTFLSLPAESTIVFGGDGGAFVLSTILMATFYAPRGSALYEKWGMRWALLAIGALIFVHVFLRWSGPYENIPFGEIEGVNLSDPSLLTEMHGWTVIQLVDRYMRLAEICLAALESLYVWGLISAYWSVARKR